MTAPLLFVLLLQLAGEAAMVAALAASPPRPAPGTLAAVEQRPCGLCRAHTLHLVDTAEVGICAGCRTENPRTYTAA